MKKQKCLKTKIADIMGRNKKQTERKKTLNKNNVTVMMTGSLAGSSFFGVKKLLKSSDLNIGILKTAVADKEKTIEAAASAGFDYIIDRETAGDHGYVIKTVKNLNMGIVHFGEDILADENIVIETIDQAVKSGAEFIIVYAGFGTGSALATAEMLAEAGADYILGYGKKRIGPYDVIKTSDDRLVPAIYSCGGLSRRQGESVVIEVSIAKEHQDSVKISGEAYHPYRAAGKIVSIDAALRSETEVGERLQLEESLLAIKAGMGVNRRCRCSVAVDKTIGAMLQANYTDSQQAYESRPVLTAKKMQTKAQCSGNVYYYDDDERCFVRKKDEAEREAAIICTGHIEYSRAMEEEAECFGNYEFGKKFKEISALFEKADFVLGNLNAMASSEYPSTSEISLRDERAGYNNCRTELLETMELAGFTGIAAAGPSNACLGIEGVFDTEKAIKEHNMIPCGIGYNKNPIVEINGIKVGLLSMTSDCINSSLTGEAVADFLQIFNPQRVRSEIKAIKAKGAEFVLVYIQCGFEKNKLSLEKRKTLAETVAEAGADYIVCTGARDVSEYYRFATADGRIVSIATSLGCLLAAEKEGDLSSVILRIAIRRDFDGSIHVSDTYIPVKKDFEMPNKIGNEISGNHHRDLQTGDRTAANLTIAEVYEILGKTPSDKDLEIFGDKYNRQISLFTIKEGMLREDCVAIIYKYTNFGQTEDFVWDISKCVDAGASLIIDNEYHDELPCIVTDEPLMHVYEKLANALIRRYRPVKVVVTGSMGKTTTKQMAVEVFKTHFNTATNIGNTNSNNKVGLMIQELTEEYEAYIQEANGGTIGSASAISRVIEPDIAILTNIEKNHMSQVGSLDNLIKAKMGIIDGLKPEGVLIACMDNSILRDIDTPVRTIKYSISDSTAHYYAKNVRVCGEELLFDIVVNESEFDHAGVYPARIAIQGEHNVGNAIAAFAAGRQAGIPPHEAVAGLSRYRPKGIRQNIFDHNGIKMIIDTYNSNPVALLAMFDVLAQYKPAPGGRKILILGMMGEQGENSHQIHYDTGKAICKHDFDVLFCFGEDAKYMAEAVKECGKEAYYFNDRSAFNRMISENVRPGDVVLVKGSHSVELDTKTMVPVFGRTIRRI